MNNQLKPRHPAVIKWMPKVERVLGAGTFYNLSYSVAIYLAHTADGVSMGEIARAQKKPASTMMRRIRYVENAREFAFFDVIVTAIENGTANGRPLTQEMAAMLATVVKKQAHEKI